MGQYLPNSSGVWNAGWKVAVMRLQIYPSAVRWNLEFRKVVFTCEGATLFFFHGIVFILNFRCIFKHSYGLTSLLCIQSNLLTEYEITDPKNIGSIEGAFQFVTESNSDTFSWEKCLYYLFEVFLGLWTMKTGTDWKTKHFTFKCGNRHSGSFVPKILTQLHRHIFCIFLW